LLPGQLIVSTGVVAAATVSLVLAFATAPAAVFVHSVTVGAATAQAGG
jgi:hypothetical protein